MGTNMINDYFDHVSGNDELNRNFVRPFSGGSRMIQLGLLTPPEALTDSLVCFFLGSLVGIYLVWTRGPLILILGIVGVISGFFYSAPPFKFANRGIGELIIGLNFGLLMAVGSYYVQVQSFDAEPVFVALPVMFLITAVVYINEFPDYEADRAVSETTMVVLLGRRRAVTGYVVIMTLAYLSIILSVTGGMISPHALLGLISLPLAVKAVDYLRHYYEKPFDLVPANVSTIMAHLITGTLLISAYIIERLGLKAVVALLPLAIVTVMVIVWLHRHIENQRRTFEGIRKAT